AVRVHLDDAPEDGGALRVIPGSHTHGTLSRLDMETLLKEKPVQVCPANSGDAFAMRPLLLHGSLPAQRPDRRRVLHFEFATGELPPPLLWPEGSILVPDSEVR
ncbi:MAG: phytanoyl-CoA dioxygenase family protein, partial [Acidobacteriota bacterium]